MNVTALLTPQPISEVEVGEAASQPSPLTLHLLPPKGMNPSCPVTLLVEGKLLPDTRLPATAAGLEAQKVSQLPSTLYYPNLSYF